MEPWEGLDVDDSELSSFLLPPKRKALDPDHTPLPPPPSSDGALTLNPSPSSSIFRPCSQLYWPRDLSNPQLTSNSQTLASDSLSRLEASPRLPEQPNNSPRRIPGPAGALQAAMRRKDRNKELLMQGDDGAAPIPTQEYIRRAVENQDGDDSDFSLNPWVCAVDFVRREGLVSGDGAAIGTPLCAIWNGLLADKVAQVVAIVKSCNSNGLGGLMVTLKDPTGSIGASIHRRVLNYGSFSKEISVGAVLILQKVAVFSPSRSVHYLNVTLNNVVKVISKHIGPLSEKICHVPTVKRASVEENNEKTCPSEARISHSRGRVDGIMSSFRRSANTPASRHSEQPCVVQAVDSYCNLRYREHSSSVEKEPISTRSDADHRSGEAEVDEQMTRANAGGVSVGSEVAKRGNNGGGYYTKENSGTSNAEEISEDAEGGNMNSNEEQKTTGVSGSSLPEPEWTDQQLEELLGYD